MDHIEEIIQNLELLRLYFGDITKTCMANGIIDAAIKEIKKFGSYEDVRLPCKVGTQIYAITYDYEQDKYVITETEISEVTQNCNGWFFRPLINIPAFRSCDFGEIAFLTREEAEAKLKKMEGESDEID